jgi:hypothetical protein
VRSSVLVAFAEEQPTPQSSIGRSKEMMPSFFIVIL